MRLASSVVIVVGLATSAIAGPKQASKAAPHPAIKMTAEIQKFAKDMAASFDQLVDMAAQADGTDKAGKFEQAASQWLSIRLGAQALENHAALAARAGSFGEPMRFATKQGALTPKTYVAKLRALGANADVRSGKSLVARDAEAAKKLKIGFPDGVARAVVKLEAEAQLADQLEKRDPSAALRQTKSTIAVATGLRQNVASAVKNKRADANTTYPLKPKAATSAEVVARLDTLIKTKKARVASLEAAAKQAAAKAAKAAPHTSSSSSSSSSAANASASNASEAATAESVPSEPVETPVAGETCNDHTPSCDMFDLPCCPGLQCLPAGWICGEGCDGLTGQTPDYYSCLDPDLAPKR